MSLITDLPARWQVTDLLDAMKVQHQTYYHVAPDPTLAIIQVNLQIQVIGYTNRNT